MIKLVLDTNVLVSGIFWPGVPAKIIDAWHEKTIKDDKFIATGIAAICNLIVSGDNDWLTVTGYAGIQIITPNKFVKQYLE